MTGYASLNSMSLGATKIKKSPSGDCDFLLAFVYWQKHASTKIKKSPSGDCDIYTSIDDPSKPKGTKIKKSPSGDCDQVCPSH